MIESLETLISQTIQSLKNQPTFQSKTLFINDYIDRQLKHLVIAQQFNFNHIAYLLGMMFPQNKHKVGRKYCQQRWTQLHLLRKHKINERNKDNRKLIAVVGFQNPKKLLTARELVKQLGIQQDKRIGEQVKQQFNGEKSMSFNQLLKNQNQFDITKDKIKSIPVQKFKAMQQQYLSALAKAQLIQQDMCQKPYIYKPKFIVDNMYQLQRQDLTQQKAKQIVNNEIKLDSKVINVGSFQQFNQDKYKSKFQKQQQKYQPRSKGIFTHIIQDKWSDYQSDDDT